MATLIDGFNDLSGGMDASRTSEVISETHYALGVNVVARDGMPQTRPSFRRVELSVPDALKYGRLQGAGYYYNPASGAGLLLQVISGRVYSIDPLSGAWEDLSAADGLVNDTTAKHWLTQVESFMVITDGRDGTLIFDGSKIRRAGEEEIPIGTITAYGQGRIALVSPDFTEILFGDLIFGGSTSTVEIRLSSPDDGITKITTTEPHGLATGDTVTIQRHYSTPSIIGTWTITATGLTTFTIPAPLTAGSSGGQVLRANDGVESDVLRFTEYTFDNEKGVFRLPAWMGPITAVVFFPVQDTGTGQGDVLVAGTNGACSFAVSAPRDTWLNIQIQRVALTQIGFGGSRAHAQVNGDIFFGASDSEIRSYRNARAEFGQYGNSPLSAEVRPIIDQGRFAVSEASMAVQDNRLLYTTYPKAIYAADGSYRYVFQSLTVLDFQQSSRISKGVLAAYDGMWTGLNFAQLIQANFGGSRRTYAWCWQLAQGGDFPYQNELWEITDRISGYDSFGGCDGSDISKVEIRCVLDTKSFIFAGWRDIKRLTRLDAWLSEVRSDAFQMAVYWRPDQNPSGWFFWGGIFVQAGLCAYLEERNDCANQPQVRPAYAITPGRLGTPPVYDDGFTGAPADRGFSFQLRLMWSGAAQVKKLLAYAENLTDPVQGAARAAVDTSTERTATFMQDLVTGPYSHRFLTGVYCSYFPCVSWAEILTSTPPDEFLVRFTPNDDGPAEIQVAQGDRNAVFIGNNFGSNYWSISFDNGFGTGIIELRVVPEADLEYTGTAFRVTITPLVSNPETDESWTGIFNVIDCFPQPLLITLGESFTPTPP